MEVPNPGFLPGRILGRFWFQWLQPQHLRFFSIATMEKLLRESGFTPLARHVPESHIPIDFVMAAMFLLRLLAPPDTTLASQERLALRLAALRCFHPRQPPDCGRVSGGHVAVAAVQGMLNMSNNYLVVARRNGMPEKPAASESPPDKKGPDIYSGMHMKITRSSHVSARWSRTIEVWDIVPLLRQALQFSERALQPLVRIDMPGNLLAVGDNFLIIKDCPEFLCSRLCLILPGKDIAPNFRFLIR